MNVMRMQFDVVEPWKPQRDTWSAGYTAAVSSAPTDRVADFGVLRCIGSRVIGAAS